MRYASESRVVAQYVFHETERTQNILKFEKAIKINPVVKYYRKLFSSSRVPRERVCPGKLVLLRQK